MYAEDDATVLGVADADRVVEVASVDGVDREREALANVSAVGLATQRLVDVEPNRGGLLADGGRELRAQTVLADGDLNLDVGIVLPADGSPRRSPAPTCCATGSR